MKPSPVWIRRTVCRASSGFLFAMLLAFGTMGAQSDVAAFDPIVFELMEGTGVDAVVEPSRTDRKHQPETMISGVALFDYDNDGKLDVYIVSGATMPGLEKTEKVHYNRLYRNLGDWKFQDVTEVAGVRGRGYTHGVVVGDYDNDGNRDLFVAGLRENILYHNRGDGTFEDVTVRAGLANPDPKYGTLWSVAAAFLDFDRDGWLDLFVSNYCVWDPETEPVCGPAGTADYCHPQHYEGLPNSLFRNRGDGTFTDVSIPSGIRNHIGKGMGLGVADFDGDGWIDVYVANDTVPAFQFRNLGDGTFSEIAFESGTAYTYSGAAVSGMGVDARDINNDGRVDIFVAAMTNESMPLYLNLGDNSYDEITAPSRLGMMTRDKTGWSNGIFDLNNDGWKDLFVASGDVMDPGGTFGDRVLQPNTLFVNLKNGTFADAAPTAGHEFAARRAVHRGVAFGDLDDDGRIDAVVTALSAPTEVWRNVSPVDNRWLIVSLIGSKSNRDGMGSKIRIETDSGKQYNHVNTAVGYGCASDVRVHFGLGRDALVKKLEISWPSGQTQTVENVQVDQIITLKEPGQRESVLAPNAEIQKLAGGFAFTEGPAVDAQGNIYFTDQPNDRILKWSTEGLVTTFKQPAGRSNGLYFDSRGNLLACADENNQLWSISPEGQVTVLVRDYRGRLLNGPNDLWVRPDGGIYFTDPFYQRSYWNRGAEEQDRRAVYFLAADGSPLKRVEEALLQPNGIVGTPDGEKLYVSDIKGKKTYAYKIGSDGQLRNRELFCPMGSDGMTLDEEGNVYLTGQGVTVFSRQGRQLEHIAVDERWTANICFGGKDRKTLFITASESLYAIQMSVRGVR